jgi:hypothetical protein
MNKILVYLKRKNYIKVIGNGNVKEDNKAMHKFCEAYSYKKRGWHSRMIAAVRMKGDRKMKNLIKLIKRKRK